MPQITHFFDVNFLAPISTMVIVDKYHVCYRVLLCITMLFIPVFWPKIHIKHDYQIQREWEWVRILQTAYFRVYFTQSKHWIMLLTVSSVPRSDWTGRSGNVTSLRILGCIRQMRRKMDTVNTLIVHILKALVTVLRPEICRAGWGICRGDFVFVFVFVFDLVFVFEVLDLIWEPQRGREVVPGGLELFTGGQKMAESRTFRFQIISDFHILTFFRFSTYFRFWSSRMATGQTISHLKTDLGNVVLWTFMDSW